MKNPIGGRGVGCKDGDNPFIGGNGRGVGCDTDDKG